MVKKKYKKNIGIKLIVWLVIIAILLFFGVYLFNNKIAKNKIDLNDGENEIVNENFEKKTRIKDDRLIGVWKGIYEDLLIERNNLSDYYIEFQRDRTYAIFDGDYKEYGNYKVDGDKLIFYGNVEGIEGIEESINYYAQIKIEGDEMVLFFPQYPKSIVYRRKG